MTATDTESALLAAVRANPGEDAPRLVYADWLEENAGTVACRLCKGEYDEIRGVYGCKACSGFGRVSDGRAELAEFVRVQVELAKRNPRDCNQGTCRTGGRDRPCTACREREELQARERELWPAVRGRFEGYGVEPCCQTGLMVHQPPDGEIVQRSTVLIRRGLPAVVRCTLAEWMGERCERCQGRGHRTLYGDGSGPWTKCQYCVDGRTPGIGPRLAQRWPIVAVEVTNREPSDGSVTRWNGFAGGYGWFRVEVFPGNPNEREDLPKEVFDRLTGGQIIDKDTNWRVYDSEHAARAALSDAMLAWARGQSVDGGI